MEQQARVRMFYSMASICAAVLFVAGIALGIMGKPAGWIIACVDVLLWIALRLLLKNNRDAESG
ncbi:hypothetical protein ABT071_21725 [Streptomyces sp. NPDC002506]|uniref:hypothetical protein n=1 Tax=Streptomyces sp. NPDC002506 TaxID=3154536 RepID=UPI00333093A9